MMSQQLQRVAGVKSHLEGSLFSKSCLFLCLATYKQTVCLQTFGI